MSTPRILLFKSELKKFLLCICPEAYVKEKAIPSFENRWKKHVIVSDYNYKYCLRLGP